MQLDINECPQCHRTFRAAHERQVFCGGDCQRRFEIKRTVNDEVRRTAAVARRHLGSWSEIIASAWLLELGYEVFRNVSDKGPIDLIAIKNNEVTFIDVKSIQVKMKVGRQTFGKARAPGATNKRLKAGQREFGIVPLFVSPDGICSFDGSKLEEVYDVAFKNVVTRESS